MDKINQNVIGRACNTHGRYEKFIQRFYRNNCEKKTTTKTQLWEELSRIKIDAGPRQHSHS
jgi:hypothetical protein